MNLTDERLRDSSGLPLRVLIAEDHDILREVLADLLVGCGASVVGLASDGQKAVVMARALRPAVILMDLSMPALGGADAMRLVLSADPDIRVVAVSGHVDRGSVEAAFAAGASAYVFKDSAYEDLEVAILAALAGERFVSRALAGGAIAAAERPA
ncbi:MAG: response regulator transcription factor [Myxococcota bacterium]